MTHPRSTDPFDGTLYVGANYHPHDSTETEWRRDLAMMKEAGFRVLRAGHLAWDSYEPQDGVFTFAWFDRFMDLAAENEIGVIVDIAIRPAPLWLHRKHPTIDVVNIHGKRQHANTRYLEDVGDPGYVSHALRFADEMSSHYAKHPALLAFGIDNEPGSGPYSYSDSVRDRFISWLREKYTTTDRLNAAWGGQRWSRRVSDFDEIDLPRSGDYEAPTERFIDFRTFVSDEVLAAHTSVIDRVAANAPGTLLTGNQWYYREGAEGRFFDYAPVAYGGVMTRGGAGLYPRDSQVQRAGLNHALAVIARIQFETPTPHWAVEATTEVAAPGLVRKAAYASLIMGNQMVCGWTWQTHHAGEERFMQGMIDWDGEPNRKYEEYAQLAAEFRRIERFGLPYRPEAQIALAFSFESQLASAAYPEKHDTQLESVLGTILDLNHDARVVDIRRSSLDYQILILPGVAVIDQKTADRVHKFVEEGGTAIMTSYSASFEESGQLFRTTRPGLLADVFGIRVGSYQEPHILNEVSTRPQGGDSVILDALGERLEVPSPRFDEVSLRGATTLATLTGLDREYAAVTSNEFGAGRAIYLALPARHTLMNWVISEELVRRGIRPSIDAPRGVIARRTDPRHALFVNLSGEPQTIALPGEARSVLSEQELGAEFSLAPYDAEFIEFD